MDLLNSSQIFEYSPDAMIIIDQQGRIVHANSNAEVLFGYSGEELIGNPIELLLPDPIKKQHIKHRSLFFANPSTRRMGDLSKVFLLRRKNGIELSCDISLSPFDTHEGRFVISSIRDISELHNLKVRVEYICDNAPIGLCYFDRDLRFVHINQWLASMNGLTVNEHIGYTISEVIPSIAKDIEAQLRQVIQTGEPVIDGTVIGNTSAYPNEVRSFVHSYYPHMADDGTVIGIRCIVKDITELKQLKVENEFLREEVQLQHSHNEILGKSLPIRKLLKLVEQVAPTEASVLLMGETGTGKELVAREIHRVSSRAEKIMVVVNCAALPATLIESELFGREKGAFTGALAKQLGRFEVANHSTIFLDEIGELPMELQPKLLRVLQEGEFERLGGTQTVKVDVRVIAATNRDLEKMINEGTFRDDLFYRLSAFPITIPPLRERKEDIPELVWSFVNKYRNRMGKRIENIPEPVMQQLLNYQWFGNVRELQNVIERAMILSPGKTLSVQFNTLDINARTSSSRQLRDVERTHIRSVLVETNWQVRGEKGAAAVLGLKPTTLESRMVKLGIKHQ